MNEVRFLNSNGLASWMVMVAFCTLLVTPHVARGQSDDPNNAAVWYQRAIDRFGRLSVPEVEALSTYAAIGGTPSPQVRDILRRMAPAIADIQRAADRPYSDFNLNFDDGVFMALPHLGSMRGLARLVQADAKLKLSQGDTAGAATEIASVYRMADRVGDDHVLISTLVSAAVFNMSEDLVKYGFDQKAFGSAETTILLQAVKSFDQNDPFQAVDALASEQAIVTATIRQYLDHADVQGVVDLADFMGGDDPVLDQFEGEPISQLRHELDSYDALMGQMVEIFAMDDQEAAKAELAKIEEGIENGEYGTLASVLAPALSRCYEALDKSRKILHDRVESLEGILAGEVDAVELANAAVWYRRGIVKLDELDGPWRNRLIHFDPLREQPVNELIDSIDEDRQAVIDAAVSEFLTGSVIRQCDFSRGRLDAEIVVPKYAGGMRDAFALMAIDALRLARESDLDGAAKRLAAGFRMCGHLGGDGQVLSAIVAQDGFHILKDTGYILLPPDRRSSEDLPVGNGLSTGRIAELSSAVARISPTDPFGFIAAKVAITEDVRRKLQWKVETIRADDYEKPGFDPAEAENAKKTALAWLEGRDLPEQWYLSGVLAMMWSSSDEITDRLHDAATRFNDLSVPVALDLAAIDAEVLDKLCRSGQWSSYTIPAIVHELDWVARMKRARSDQSQGVRLSEGWASMARALAKDEKSAAKAQGVESDQ